MMVAARVPGTETLRILVADDQIHILEALRLLLKGAGYESHAVDSPGGILRALDEREFDAVVMDLNYTRDTTSGKEGLDLLERLHARVSTPPVIVMTAWGSVDLAVEAMRLGACDFIQKPWDNDRLLEKIEKHARQASERRRADRMARMDLEIAHKVQSNLLPQGRRRLETLDCAGRCIPAGEVGGDFFDYIDLGPERVGFVLADVSGKGIAAALLMANLQATLRGQCESAYQGPASLAQTVNRRFHESTAPEHYATLFFGDYDGTTRRLQYINCGHHAPVLVRAGGAVEALSAATIVMGLFREMRCRTGETSLEPGDTIVVVSDGVLEAGVDDGEDFGRARLEALVRAGTVWDIGCLVDTIVDDAIAFAPTQGDDMTVLGLRAL
jgi:sigma-B regulation protein RsbU (phosphoserine phosphatase)